MADLAALIRYRRHGVDEKRRALAALYRQAEEIEKQKQVILNQAEEEKRLARETGSAEIEAYLGRYLEGARAKIRKLDIESRQLETRILVAQEDVRSAFADLKKAEIVQRARADREQAERERRETAVLDEIGADRHRRRQDE